jgi:hypothetical protein
MGTRSSRFHALREVLLKAAFVRCMSVETHCAMSSPEAETVDTRLLGMYVSKARRIKRECSDVTFDICAFLRLSSKPADGESMTCAVRKESRRDDNMCGSRRARLHCSSFLSVSCAFR